MNPSRTTSELLYFYSLSQVRANPSFLTEVFLLPSFYYRPEYPSHLSDSLVDLLRRLLNKDPSKRATIPEIREHPWTTGDGEIHLIPQEENLMDLVWEITDKELDEAVCRITSVL